MFQCIFKSYLANYYFSLIHNKLLHNILTLKIANIVEAGYDKQEFAEYMSSCKDNGTNIDEWNLLELMDMVHDFQKSHKITNHDNHEHDGHAEEEKNKGMDHHI